MLKQIQDINHSVISYLRKGIYVMDIRVLRYFLAVAREENITRAAESLHISQPSLSKQLMELEDELGKQLLIRGKRKVTLTEDGVLLRKRADVQFHFHSGDAVDITERLDHGSSNARTCRYGQI